MDNFIVKGDEVRYGEHLYLDALSKQVIESLSNDLLSNTLLAHLSDGTKPIYPISAQVIAESYKEPGGMVFALRLKSDDTCIGFARLDDVSWQGRHAALEVGIIDEQYLTREMLRDALQTLLQFVYWEANLNRIYAQCVEDQTLMRDVLVSVGFTHEGDLRQEAYRNGRYLDIGVYSILQSDWQG